jgi:hypothetical protein
MGLLQKSTRGLGTVRVKGLSLVPKPPTRMIALRLAEDMVTDVKGEEANVVRKRHGLRCSEGWRGLMEGSAVPTANNKAKA